MVEGFQTILELQIDVIAVYTSFIWEILLLILIDGYI